MSIVNPNPRRQGTPAPGGPPFDISRFEPGDIVSWLDTVQVSGYTISKGPRKGTHVLPYLRTVVRQYEVPEPPIKAKAPPPIPSGRAGRMMPLPEYMELKYDEWEYFEIQDPIYRKDELTDLIDPRTLFIWHKPLKDYTFKSMSASEAALVRVWVLLYNSNKDEYFVFCRTRSLLDKPGWTRESVEDCYKAHVSEGYFDEQLGRAYPSLYEDIKDWAETTDYVEVREILAWTVFNFPAKGQDREKAPSKTYAKGRAEHPRKSRRGRRKVRLYTR